jgi:hypothetical protein
LVSSGKLPYQLQQPPIFGIRGTVCIVKFQHRTDAKAIFKTCILWLKYPTFIESQAITV